MISRVRKILGRGSKSSQGSGLRFNRPLVLFQSDDWGRVGVCDREGWNELQAGGLNMGAKPYDFYSLEAPDDLHALSDVLKKHRDSTGRRPCIGMNFVMANVDFPRVLGVSPKGNSAEKRMREIPLRPLTDGFPEPWQRSVLIDAYQEGIRDRVFYPALHGLTHFCAAAIERELESNGERYQLLRTLWRAGTPYIHWRMPWIGFEYWDPSLPPNERFLTLAKQRTAIHGAAEIYRALFASIPLSACAPGYRANHDTKTAWFEAGIRVVQGGPGELQSPVVDTNGMLLIFRNVEMELATDTCELATIVKRANDCLSRGLPAIVSIHSINFHSTIRDFRTPTLSLLHDFLSALERKWPDLLYAHDADLWHIVTEGFFDGETEKIRVDVTSSY